MERRIIYAVLVAVVILLGIALWSRAYERGQWEEREGDLQGQVDSTAVLLSQYRTDSAEAEAQLAVLAQQNNRLASDSAALKHRADSLERAYTRSLSRFTTLQTTVDTSQLPPPIRELLGAASNAAELADSARVVCEERLGVAQHRYAGCEDRRVITHQQLTTTRRLLRRMRAERDSAIALLKPPSWFRLTFEVGAGVGCVYGTGDGTLGCGPGVQITMARFRFPMF